MIAMTGGASLLGGALSAQARDTVILRSGLPVVGDVQELRRGKLLFDTDEMGVVSIDWDDIAFMRSSKFFEVELSSGEEFFGSLAGADTAQLVVVGPTRSDTVAFDDVVIIRAFESGFLARTSGFVDLGSNIARANQLRSVLLKGQFNYRGPEWGFGLSLDLYRQRQRSVDAAGDTTIQQTMRTSGIVTGSRYIGARWGLTGAMKAEQNDELNLDSRFLALLAAQYRFIRTQGAELAAGVGATLNDEQYVGDDPSTVPEVLVGGLLDIFDVGDIDIYVSLTSYFSAADGGRVRLNVDGRIAWEIFSDFTVGLNTTDQVDTRPPAANAGKRDYQYAITIGWSW
jgi:Protein of unknown function, DUF481